LNSCYIFVDGVYWHWGDPNAPAGVDEVIPPVEQEWLENDLSAAEASNPDVFHVILVHQPIHNEDYVGNAADVRAILEQHRVVAVLQGHMHCHRHNVTGENSLGKPIHYITFEALSDGDYPIVSYGRFDIDNTSGSFSITVYETEAGE
ncbi:unnamed protein product, partial [marine sediment metagenome]